MKLEDLLSSLSVGKNTGPLIHKKFQILIEQYQTDVTFEEFTDYYLLVANQAEGTSSVVGTKIAIQDGIAIQSHFVCGNQNSLQAAHDTAVTLNLNKPLCLFLCMRNYEDNLVTEFKNEPISNLTT